MANDDPVVAQVMSNGVGSYMTRRQKIERWVLRFWVVVSIGTAVGVVSDRLASNDVAACTNTNLNQRNAPSQADATANIADAKAASANAVVQNSLIKAETLVLIGDSTNPVKAKTDYATILLPAFKTAEASSASYAAEAQRHAASLATDQDQRNAHPLGKC